jgi:hypothetical protein
MSGVREFYADLRVEIPDRPGEWIDVRCFDPAHDHDLDPSCGIHMESGGFNCMACGAKGSAISAAVLLGRTHEEAVELAKLHDLYQGRGKLGAIVATYPYVDEDGGFLYQTARFESKSFRQRRPAKPGDDPKKVYRDPDGSEWVWNIQGKRRVLYRLPKVIEAVKRGDLIYVVEGEKDVAAVERVGAIATCNPMGAEKWRDDYSEFLRGARVMIVEDQDDAGRRHSKQVAASLDGVAASVTVVAPVTGKDAHDHLQAGHTLDEFVPVEHPSPPKSTEHTEHDPSKPDGERDSGVRGGAERDPNTTRTRPELATAPDILKRFDGVMGKLGLVGERNLARTVKLMQVSSFLPKPGRAVIKGDSSTGKSFASECTLDTAAPENLYVRTGTSAKALFYSEEDLRHKTVVFYEANDLNDDDNPLAAVLRTLISEGRLVYESTDIKARKTELLEKEGPVAFLTTTCAATLNPELETRILSLAPDGSNAQTGLVVERLLTDAADGREAPDLSEWHELDRWLAENPCDVALPWATALATFKLTGPPRLRRDISNLISLAKAHTLLHQATRERDERGRIISTLADYEAVRELIAGAMAVAADKAVRPQTREVVNAVRDLRDEGKKPVTLRAAAIRAGRSPSTTHHDVHDALDSGYLVNVSPAANRFDLDVMGADPLPEEIELLPSRKQMEAAVFASCSPPVREGAEHRKPAPGAGSEGRVRRVRPNPGGKRSEPSSNGQRWSPEFPGDPPEEPPRETPDATYPTDEDKPFHDPPAENGGSRTPTDEEAARIRAEGIAPEGT